jgi:nucleoid DNA-binding protein
VSVTFQKLAARVQADIENDPDVPRLTQQQLMQLMARTFGHIGDALAYGEDVYLEGFGRFYPDCKPPRKVRSGLTSEVHTTQFKVFVRFNPFKQLNTRVQKYLERLGLNMEDTDAS